MAASPVTGAPPARPGSVPTLPRRTDAFAPPEDGLDNESGQAHVRFAICCFMAVYYVATGFSTHPLYLGFSVYCLSYLALVRRARRFSAPRVVLALLLDNFFTVGGLYVTGSQGLFLYIFLIHISFGYGVRYGRAWLWMSVSAACLGVLTLYLSSPHWRGNVHAMIAYFLGVPFIALYIDYFVQRLRRAQRESEQRADEVTRLLGFVAHDIRTPLQSLLSTIETTRAGSQEAGTQLRLGRMEQAVQVLARMATEVLSAARSPLAAPSAQALPTYTWFIGIVDIFRDEFARQGARLDYDFDYALPCMIRLDRLAAERLLLNALSNAARHAAGGEVRVGLAVTEADGAAPTLVFTITNRAAPSSASMHATLAPPSTLHGAGLGLLGAEQTAHSAHGSFHYETTDATTHVSRFTVPVQAAANTLGPPVLLPVAILAQPAAATTLQANLADTASCICFKRADDLLAHADSLRPRLAALFVAGTALHGDAQLLARLQAALGPVTLFDAAPGMALHDGSAVLNHLLPDMPAHAAHNSLQVQAALRDVDNGQQGQSRAVLHHRLAGRRLLLVEDNVINAEMLAEVLQACRMNLHHAVSLAEARQQLARAAWDVVVLDWHLGDGCGEELVDELRRRERDAGLRTIVLSAESASIVRHRLHGRLDCPVVQRPASVERILQAIVLALQLPDTVSPGNVLRPQSIFTVDIYEDLRAAHTSTESILSLLARASAALDAALTDLDEALCETPERGTLCRCLHDVKSIADAVGAHELGAAAARQIDAITDAEAAQPLPDGASTLHALWHLTRDHMAVYQYSLGP